MLLFLSGTTDLTRGLIVDRFLESHTSWRHLSLDAIEGEQFEEGDPRREFLLLFACECAREAEQEGMDVLLTSASPDALPAIRKSLKDDVRAVHFGRPPRGNAFDYVVDTGSLTLNSASRLLAKLAKI